MYCTARNAGRELDLEVGETLTLRQREPMGALVAELECLTDVGGQRVAALLQVGGGHLQRARPSVEVLGVCADRVEPVALDVPQHLGDPFDDLGVALRGRPVDCGPLQPGERAKCAGFVGGDLHDRRR